MRNRIDLRWILSTAVVVAVAAAGTAATMRMRAPGSDDLDSALEAPASFSRTHHRVAEVEPARLSHAKGGPPAAFAAFKSEALPPLVGQEASARSGSPFSSPENMSVWSTGSARSSASGSYSSSSGGVMGAGGQGGGGIGSAGAGSIAGSAKGTNGDGQPSHTTAYNGSSEGSPSVGGPAASNPGAPAPNAGSPAGPSAPSPVGGLLPALPAADGTAGAPSSAGAAGALAGDPPTIAFDVDPGQPSVGPGALSPTPEPGSLLLIGTGLVGMAGALRRRFK